MKFYTFYTMALIKNKESTLNRIDRDDTSIMLTIFEGRPSSINFVMH